MELKSMVDYALSKEEALNNYEKIHYYGEGLDIALGMVRYANFLKQPLTLSMFVPCGDDGGVLEFPNRTDDYWRDANGITDEFYNQINKFNKGKERCLFEGFEVFNDNNDFTRIELKDRLFISLYKESKDIIINAAYNNKRLIKNVEDLNDYNLTLTQTAINQITK